MTVAPIAADVAAASMQPLLGSSQPTGGALFEKLMTQVDGMNDQMLSMDRAVAGLANGETENLHQVILSLERTRTAFDLMLQVRNKVLDAYQEIMRMQV